LGVGFGTYIVTSAAHKMAEDSKTLELGTKLKKIVKRTVRLYLAGHKNVTSSHHNPNKYIFPNSSQVFLHPKKENEKVKKEIPVSSPYL
jgi:hypothetical protein